MAEVIRMPLLSDTMTEGKIVAWNKAVGDTVKSDDVLADVETDKATMEVTGYADGVLLYIGVPEGEAAKINQIIAIVGKEGEDYKSLLNEEGKTAAPAEEKLKEDIAEQPKPTEEEPTSAKKDQPPTKNSLPRLSGDEQETTNEKRENEKQETRNENKETTNDQRIKASPLAKKMADEKGLDISKITGTGDGGRIIKNDIDGYKETASDDKQTTADNKKIAAFAGTGKESYTDIPLTQMRKTIARRLGESMFTAPHFYLTTEVNMDNAIAARKTVNEVSPVKVSFNDLIIKACASALRLHPEVNSSFMGDFIRRNDHINIGSAIALPEGLIVPVIKFADQKTLSQIAANANELYTKAKEKKIQPEEFSGNTFTISNLGMMDIEEFTAIINPPDSCILAVGKIKETVVSRDGKFETANVMKLTMSCDHRSVDGAVGAAFLQTLKKFIENPVTMLV